MIHIIISIDISWSLEKTHYFASSLDLEVAAWETLQEAQYRLKDGSGRYLPSTGPVRGHARIDTTSDL